MVNEYKLNKIVESIRANGFEFETFEVEENLYGILAFYSMSDIGLSKEEELILKKELMELAEQYEFAEVLYLASQDDFLLSSIPERHFSLKAGLMERKSVHSAVV